VRVVVIITQTCLTSCNSDNPRERPRHIFLAVASLECIFIDVCLRLGKPKVMYQYRVAQYL
jgi:hypothetical protein